MKIPISVIIITKDRSDHLKNLLTSLKENSFTNFELIIVDQSKKEQISDKVLEILNVFQKVIYLKSKQSGKSKGLNLAIKVSSCPLIAFTDDDCLPDKYWINNIIEAFRRNNKVIALFGRTIPYQPKKHIGLLCPATFDHRNTRFVTKPCKHWEKIGFGNNMAWRKKFFNKFGLFKEWLGPGSIGSNAEDAEISLRALINKQMIMFEPRMKIYHNKWLNKEQHQRQTLSYTCGEMACYGHFLYRNKLPIAREVVVENFLNIINDFKNNKDKIFSLKKTTYKLFGLLVGLKSKK